MKKIRGDEPIAVILHTYVEISQGNFLCSYFYLKQAKMACFSFYLFCFFSYKIGEQEDRTNPAQEEVLGPVGVGEVLGKKGRRVNTVQKNLHTCK
jgi:hypothetical protein